MMEKTEKFRIGDIFGGKATTLENPARPNVSRFLHVFAPIIVGILLLYEGHPLLGPAAIIWGVLDV